MSWTNEVYKVLFMGYVLFRLSIWVCFYYVGACIWLFMIQLFKAD